MLPLAIGWTFFFSGFSKMQGVPLSWHRRQGAFVTSAVRCGEGHGWAGPEPGRAEGRTSWVSTGRVDGGREKDGDSRLLRTDSCLSCTPCTLAHPAWGCVPAGSATLAAAAGPGRHRPPSGQCPSRGSATQTSSGWAGRWCDVACRRAGCCTCCLWATSTCRRTETDHRRPSSLSAIATSPGATLPQTVGRPVPCHSSTFLST